MKVLWLAQLPYIKNPTEHPVPWIGSLARLLSKRVELTIVSANSKIDKEDDFILDNIRYRYVKLERASINLLSLNYLNSNIIKSELLKLVPTHDILHIHGSEYQFQKACYDLNIPKVLSIQGIIDEYYNYIPEIISVRRILWKSAKASEKKYLPKIHDFMCRTNWDKSWVKANCPDSIIHHCWECLREDFFMSDVNTVGKSSIVFLGGVNNIKGYKEALSAFNKALNKVPDLTLVFVTGNLELDSNKIKDYVVKHNLNNIKTNNLIIKGKLKATQMIHEYRDCFCLLHPSHVDNSPNTICEAQVVGLPVIASNVGGVGSLIEHNYSGILTTLDTDEIGDAITELYYNEKKQKEVSQQAKLIARERHNAMKIVDNTLEIYNSVINSN